jgi:hypothetical protein
VGSPIPTVIPLQIVHDPDAAADFAVARSG